MTIINSVLIAKTSKQYAARTVVEEDVSSRLNREKLLAYSAQTAREKQPVLHDRWARSGRWWRSAH